MNRVSEELVASGSGISNRLKQQEDFPCSCVIYRVDNLWSNHEIGSDQVKALPVINISGRMQRYSTCCHALISRYMDKGINGIARLCEISGLLQIDQCFSLSLQGVPMSLCTLCLPPTLLMCCVQCSLRTHQVRQVCQFGLIRCFDDNESLSNVQRGCHA